jgi:hypothetical protein
LSECCHFQFREKANLECYDKRAGLSCFKGTEKTDIKLDNLKVFQSRASAVSFDISLENLGNGACSSAGYADEHS